MSDTVTVNIHPRTAQTLMDWGVLHFTDEGATIDLGIWLRHRGDNITPAMFEAGNDAQHPDDCTDVRQIFRAMMAAA